MATIREIKEKYEKAYNALHDTISGVVQQNQDVLINLNRDQLLQGRDASGQLFNPTYTQDPFFKTKEKAQRYLKKKKNLESEHRARLSFSELYGRKPDDVPNLLVTGAWFFNHFFINTTKNEYTINSNGLVASDIAQKYPHVYGIAPKSAEWFYFNYIRPAIVTLYKNEL